MEIERQVIADASYVQAVGQDGGIWLAMSDLRSLRVQLPGVHRTNGDLVAGAEWICEDCEEPLQLADDDEPQWMTVDGDRRICEQSSDPGESDRHVPVDTPLAWANSAYLALNHKEDSITLGFSVGDPRGGISMTVSRVRYVDGDGKKVDGLVLSVPNEDGISMHVAATKVGDRGMYRLG